MLECTMRSPEETSKSSSNRSTYEFPKGNASINRPTSSQQQQQHHHRMGKPTPSKWDDAQKWLVGLSRTQQSNSRNQSTNHKTKPRDSNADDTSLIAPPVPVKENDYYFSDDESDVKQQTAIPVQDDTKQVDCGVSSTWHVNKSVIIDSSKSEVRSICVRDMGTEMTPIASLEPSRSVTPIRNSGTTATAQSPIITPVVSPRVAQTTNQRLGHHDDGVCCSRQNEVDVNGCTLTVPEYTNSLEQDKKLSPLERKAVAWDEAERAKYMARYKREEMKIEAWANHEKRKAEMEMKRIEAKAERLKTRTQEKLTNKAAATRRKAEEKRANAEAELNEKASRTSERADYIRRTGHLPSTYSFKLPSVCW